MSDSTQPPVLCLFGEVRVGGRVVKGAKVASLLSLFAAHEGQVLRAARIADDLWEGAPPPTSASALRVHVSTARQVLAGTALEHAIQSSPNGYRFTADHELVDVLAFVDLVDHGTAAASVADFPTAKRLLTTALELWRGEPFGDAADLTALRGTVDRVHRARRDARLGLLQAHVELGEAASSLKDIETLVADDPYSEAVTLLQMRALNLLGRRVEALDAAHDLRVRLREDLGLSPGPAVVEAERELLELWEPPKSAPVTAVAVNRFEVPSAFVGRQAELGRITTFWSKVVADDSGRLLTVLGPAGSGKSSLVHHAARDIEHGEALVVMARGREDGVGPYEPWEHVFDELRAQASSIGLDEPFATSFAGVADHDVAPIGGRVRLTAAVRDDLRRVASARPLLLLFDDAQWLDASSTQLLAELAREGLPRGCGVLVSARWSPQDPPSPLGALLSTVSGRDGIDALQIDDLGRSDVYELVATRHGELQPAEVTRVAEHVYRRVGGNALLVNLLLDGDPREIARTDAPPPLRDARIRAVLGSRLHDLGHAEREVVNAASVLGLRFDARDVAAMTGHGELEVLALLDDAVRVRLVRLEESPFVYRFTHDLLRELVVDGLLPHQRRSLHAAVAIQLAAKRDPDPVELAHHRCAAVPIVAPRPAWLSAAAAASLSMHRLAFEAAVPLLDQAIDVAAIDSEHTPGERAGLVERRATALDLSGEFVRSRNDFLELLQMAEHHDEPLWAARAVLGGNGHGEPLAGDPVRAEMFDRALHVIGSREPQARLDILAELLFSRSLLGVTPELEAICAEAESLAIDQGTERAQAAALIARLAVSAPFADAAARLAWSDELSRLARRLPDPIVFAYPLLFRVQALAQLGDAAAMALAVAEKVRLADRTGRPVDRWAALLSSACVAEIEGDIARAFAVAHEAYQYGLRYDVPDAEVSWSAQNYCYAWQTGQLDQFAQATADYVPETGVSVMLDASVLHGRALRGDPVLPDELASIVARLQRQHRDVIWLPAACITVQVCALLGIRDHVATLRRLLDPYADLLCLGGLVAATTFGPVRRYLALLDELEGLDDRAAAQLRIAHDAFPTVAPWRGVIMADIARIEAGRS